MGATGIIVLDGADGTGKTTLARELVRSHDAFYIHNGLWSNMWRRHLAAVRLAVKQSATRLVVIDRLWLSELAYGPVFRGRVAYDTGARCLDRVLQRYRAVNVVCVRSDLTRHVADFEKLKTTRREKFDRVVEVATRYLDLVRGNVAHPGPTYLDDLIRFGDYALRSDVMVYDLDEWRDRGASFAAMIVARVTRARCKTPGRVLDPAVGNLIGNPNGNVLFVGEAVANPTFKTHWPFVAPDEPLSSAVWLNRALARLHFDETDGLWTNADDDDFWLPDLQGANWRVVALGNVAARAVERVGFANHRAISHPQFARRFQHHDLDGYVQRLGEAIR